MPEVKRGILNISIDISNLTLVPIEALNLTLRIRNPKRRKIMSERTKLGKNKKLKRMPKKRRIWLRDQIRRFRILAYKSKSITKGIVWPSIDQSKEKRITAYWIWPKFKISKAIFSKVGQWNSISRLSSMIIYKINEGWHS